MKRWWVLYKSRLWHSPPASWPGILSLSPCLWAQQSPAGLLACSPGSWTSPPCPQACGKQQKSSGLTYTGRGEKLACLVAVNRRFSVFGTRDSINGKAFKQPGSYTFQIDVKKYIPHHCLHTVIKTNNTSKYLSLLMSPSFSHIPPFTEWRESLWINICSVSGIMIILGALTVMLFLYVFVWLMWVCILEFFSASLFW